MRLDGRSWEIKGAGGHDFALNDYRTKRIGAALQPLTRRNQALGIVRLFGSTGAAIHDAQGKWRHGGVEPG
jgi:hypothetical protein